MSLSLDGLLAKTSRTFALAIPLLPQPTRRNTCVAYLLFRVADTLEDGEAWTPDARVGALDAYHELLANSPPILAATLAREWLARPPTGEASCVELIGALPSLMQELASLDAQAQDIIRRHVGRTVRGMQDTVRKAAGSGTLCLETIEELRGYCYTVAGIVGEMLTELFVHDAPRLQLVRDTLKKHEVQFGEGLQLVNILKDQLADIAESRNYLPRGVPRAEVIALARADMLRAHSYIDALECGGAPPGFVGFTSLSAELADATLGRLEKVGPGAKVPRAAVLQMVQRLTSRLGLSEIS